MNERRKLVFLAMLCAVMMTVPAFASVNAIDIQAPDTPLIQGPYVDNVVYTVISNDNERVLALQAGDIEMDTGFFDPIHYETLDMDPEIGIHSTLRNGYGHLTINCRDNPLNYSVLRRAFAYAFDKEAVVADVLDGFAQEHDSLVPYVNPWSIEDDLTNHYYTNNSALGNTMLDAAGFAIDGVTGYRNTPFGDPFNITIEYASTSTDLGAPIAQMAADAFTSLHIDAQAQATDFFDYIARLDNHGNYDIVFYAAQFGDYDVDWLAYEYWSEYADVTYENPCNFMNATYDSWREQLLNGTTYEDVYEASAEMQTILHHNVPRLVVYENIYTQAYRTDTFTGHVQDANRGIAGPWTMRKIHRIDGQPGGSVTTAIKYEPDSFNPYVTTSGSSWHILNNLYPSLYRLGPDGMPVADLATNMVAETHSDNPSVPEGHMRYTIDIISNATWSDGSDLNASNVVYTFIYNYESGPHGNPAGAALSMLTAALAPTETQVIIEFASESYWHFSDFAFTPILPRHVLMDIGFSGWDSWNPVLNPSDPHVTCGPFSFAALDAGDWYQLTKNSLYHWIPPAPSYPPQITSLGNVIYYEGETGNFVEWEVGDDDPLGYVLYMDGMVAGADTWSNSTLSFNVDGLGVGLYNFTLQLFDVSGNVVADTSWVEVLEPLTTSSTTPTSTTTSTTTATGTDFPLDTLHFALVGGVVVLAVVALVFVKMKR